jgi:FlaA1/EpsC-like NDP-sugar epimerase
MHRRLVALVVYAALAAFAYLLAFLLRYEFVPPPEAMRLFLATVLVLVGIRTLFNIAFDVTQSRWRYAGTHDALRLAVANTLGTGGFFVLSQGTPLVAEVNRSIIVAEWFLSTFLVAATWIAYRTTFERVRQLRSAGTESKRVLIVGAGEAGCTLAREMQRQPTGYRPVGFIDDDATKWHTNIHGLKVLGAVERLPELVSQWPVDEIVIAVPSAQPHELRRIVETCERNELRFKVLPGVAEVLLGRVQLKQLRDLRIEDLLGREPVSLELPELLDELGCRSVLITGAAGSIGSELARQVALHAPATLVLLDHAETPLFYLERELRLAHPNLRLVAVVGNVVDERCVDRVFRDYAPSRVYHAAAYKHVPMMQPAPREALRNNVLGTWLVADAAGRHGADKFVLVSTDKAVRPTSIMGASKRLAEVAVLTLQGRHRGTMFSAVRFGNVLGSNGSVIPIFQQQIADGRPLTVTDPDATRYFMTIPEAVQLILQASLLPEMRGAVAMLEMGEPVRIVDLARNLLRLSGTASGNGAIVFTGLRPGEKLHEELWDPEEATVPTSISKVSIVKPTDLSISDIRQCLAEWDQRYAEEGDEAVVSALYALFPSLHGAQETVTPGLKPVLAQAEPKPALRSAQT